jgi:DNA-binding transcriptional LysR family regulator
MRLTIGQLEAFVWIVRLGGVRAAAARLGLSQPALSLRVRQMERSLGRPVLRRDRYRAAPTSNGALLFERAERILALCSGIDAAGEGQFRGVLRLGVADTFAILCLPQMLVEAERVFPAARLELNVEFSARLYEHLAAGRIDIAVLTAPRPRDGIVIRPLVPLELAWVASPRLALPARTLAPRDLAGIPIITNPEPSHLIRTIEEWFQRGGIAPHSIHTCTSLTVMTTLATAGAGVALMPLALLGPELRTGQLRRLKARPRIRPHELSVAYRRDAPAQPMHRLVLLIEASIGVLPSPPKRLG